MLTSTRPRLAFWLSCFAVLMMHLGPLISGAQSLLSQENAHELQLVAPSHQSMTHHEQHADTEHDMDHHALMGHMNNPSLPQWVNDLMMCGYCDLLTFSPGLVLQLVFALPPRAAQPAVIELVSLDIYQSCLQAHAAPRAPPIFA